MEVVITKSYKIESTEQLITALNEHLIETFNINHSTVNIKLDKVFTRLLYLCKKNYCGIVDGKLYAKGLDFLKTNTIKFAASKQKDLLNKVLFENTLSFHKIISEYKNEFYTTKWDETNIDQITLMQRVTKQPEKYTTKSTPALVASWMRANNFLFYPGMFVPIIVTGYFDGKMVGCHPASGEWEGKIDIGYTWSHQILPKLSRITTVLAPQFDWQQFDPYIVEQRIRKVKTYEKQLMDTQRNDHVSTKIKQDGLLSETQKSELLELASRSRAKSLW